MRLATWNVNSLKARLPRVEAWLAEVQPDVLCVQETKSTDAAFPLMTFQALGYEGVHYGTGRWNGVAILSRVGVDDVVVGFDDGEAEDSEPRLLWATCGGIRVGTVYVPNGREVGHEQYDYKLRWLERLSGKIATANGASDPLLLCGDFNIAPDDRDVYDPAVYVGATHVSPPERAALQTMLDWGLVDVFRRFYDTGGLFSWWDYRAGNFHKGKGMRIDLVLVTEMLAERTTGVLIDRNARKGQGPSDHAPVVVDINFPARLTASALRLSAVTGSDEPSKILQSALYSRWQEPPISEMTTRRVEMRRIADSMRIIIERLVATGAPTEVIIDAADRLARVALTFDELRGSTTYEGFAEATLAGGDGHASFEHSPFMGRANPLAPPIRLQEIDGKVHARVIFGSAYEGPPSCVHGGYVAGAFDEVLGATQSLSGAPGMTGRLTVNYRSPTPLHTELHFVGEIVKLEGRKIFTEGQLYAGDRLCAEAEGLFISINPEKFLELKRQRDVFEAERVQSE